MRFRNRLLVLSDTLLLSGSVVAAYALRFEGLDLSPTHEATLKAYLPSAVALRLVVYFAFGLYRRLWRHASMPEAESLAIGTATAAFLCLALGGVLLPAAGITPGRVPLGVLVIDGLLSAALVGGTRFAVRMWNRPDRRRSPRADRRVLIAGAGTAAQLAAREMLSSHSLGFSPVGFVDDDTSKHARTLAGLPIFGSLNEIPQITQTYKITDVVIAMPSAPGSVVREIVRMAREAGASALILPGYSDILSGKVRVNELRNVEIQDLLRREPVTTDFTAVAKTISDRVVMVTGAGGSIGSELCRQIVRMAPRQLILFGHGENSIFEIQAELQRLMPTLELTPVIADTRDRERVFEIMRRLRPNVIFHAAAHKHVPLMEQNVVEAVTNNVVGTKNIVDASVEVEVERLVLISTDKAVRPTSVMGAAKRTAEQVVQLAALRHGRNFVSVRFGNVLGSRGSVVPTFLKQIRAGGPVTVTHPEMRRYFMTIPEAVQLVLQAAALGHGGEVFVLDMGEMVKIADLATDIIRLSGLEPGVDIEIVYSGVRPGEKLYEEILSDGENLLQTPHPKVLRARHLEISAESPRAIDALVDAAARGAGDSRLRELLKVAVPDFRPSVGSIPGLTLSGAPDARDDSRLGYGMDKAVAAHGFGREREAGRFAE